MKSFKFDAFLGFLFENEQITLIWYWMNEIHQNVCSSAHVKTDLMPLKEEVGSTTVSEPPNRFVPAVPQKSNYVNNLRPSSGSAKDYFE